MNLQHLNIKFFIEQQDFAIEDAVPFFHKWIREKLTDDLLIDVADYSHIVKGPGILLIGHNASYSFDTGIGGRTGLLYNQRTAVDGNPARVFIEGLQKTLKACALAEENLRLKFDASEAIIIVNDRLLGPNTQESYQELVAALEPEARRKLALQSFAYLPGEPRERLTLRARFQASRIGELLGAALA